MSNAAFTIQPMLVAFGAVDALGALRTYLVLRSRSP